MYTLQNRYEIRNCTYIHTHTYIDMCMCACVCMKGPHYHSLPPELLFLLLTLQSTFPQILYLTGSTVA